MNNFLPDGYTKPVSNTNYMKLEEGDNTFRILSSAITGYEYWTVENKPVRSKAYPKETPNAKREKDGSVRVRHFWAFVVFEYRTKSIKIMEITQKTIMDAMYALILDEDWGDVKAYDIKINKTGEGLETKYAVMPKNKTELAHDVKEKYEMTPIHLEALYEGGDPFGTEIKEATSDDIPFPKETF